MCFNRGRSESDPWLQIRQHHVTMRFKKTAHQPVVSVHRHICAAALRALIREQIRQYLHGARNERLV